VPAAPQQNITMAYYNGEKAKSEEKSGIDTRLKATRI
jgi:hypothetical protein